MFRKQGQLFYGEAKIAEGNEVILLKIKIPRSLSNGGSLFFLAGVLFIFL